MESAIYLTMLILNIKNFNPDSLLMSISFQQL